MTEDPTRKHCDKCNTSFNEKAMLSINKQVRTS